MGGTSKKKQQPGVSTPSGRGVVPPIRYLHCAASPCPFCFSCVAVENFALRIGGGVVGLRGNGYETILNNKSHKYEMVRYEYMSIACLH